MTLDQWFEKGLSTEKYIQQMKVNKESMLQIYEQFALEEDDLELLEKIKDQNLRVIVLSEDWCGDAMLNNPILLKIAEQAGMEVRFLLRDENLELMDQYLTNGTSRAIPIYIFIDEKGEEKAVWGPRAPKLQQFVQEARTSLPPKDDPSFAEKQKEVYQKISKSYIEDEAQKRYPIAS